MIVTFDKEYLKELYTDGKCKDKKHRYQPEIIRKYQSCIDKLISSNNIDNIRVINSLNYELLKGDKAGISSIRVNKQYRIEFTVTEILNETVITLCNIIELSNHYK